MKRYPLPDKKWAHYGFCVFLCALLFLSRNSLLCTSAIGLVPAQILTIAIMGAGGIAFLIANRNSFKEILLDRRVLLAIGAGLLFFIPMLVKRDWQLMYFSMYVGALFAILLTYVMDYKEAARYYVLVITVVAAYTVLATYLLRIPADRGILVPPIFPNPIGHEFYNYGLAYVSIKYVKTRNFGIFREPGVYQYFLILGMYLNNFLLTWDKPWKLWTVNAILAVTMLTTFATGGYAEMILLAAVIFFGKGYYRTREGRMVAIGAIAAVAIALTVIILQKGAAYKTVRNMVGKLFYDSPSKTDRVDSFFINLRLFAAHPFFGTTILELVEAIENNTSSSTMLFAALGLGGGLLNAAGWVALVWQQKEKVWIKLALLVILAMAFNTTMLIRDIFFWLFPVMGLTEVCLKVMHKKK